MTVPTLQRICVKAIASFLRSFYYGETFDRTRPLPPCPLPLAILPLDVLQPVIKRLIDDGLFNVQSFYSERVERHLQFSLFPDAPNLQTMTSELFAGIERVNISYFSGVLDDSYIKKLVEVCSGSLQSLTANGCVRIASFLPYFQSFSKLTRLHISSAKKETLYPYTGSLTILIRRLQFLDNLNISGWHFEDALVDAIASCGKRLTALNLALCDNLSIDSLRKIARSCTNIGAWNLNHISPVKKVSWALLTQPPRPLTCIKAAGIEITIFPEEISSVPEDSSINGLSLQIDSKIEALTNRLSSFAARAGGELLKTLCLRNLQNVSVDFGQIISEQCPNLEYLELIKMQADHLHLNCPRLSVLNLEASRIAESFLNLPKLQYLELSRAYLRSKVQGRDAKLRWQLPQLRWLQLIEVQLSVIEQLGRLESPLTQLEVLKLDCSDHDDFNTDQAVARMLASIQASDIKHLFLSVSLNYTPIIGHLTTAAVANWNPTELISLVLDSDFASDPQNLVQLVRIAQVTTKLKTFGAYNIYHLPFNQNVKFSNQSMNLAEAWADGQIILVPQNLVGRMNQIFSSV